MGVHQLELYPRLVSVAGTAEETTLRSASVDFVTAAQAAHWFDLPRARAEFVRILKPGGWCVLIWNERRTASTPFLRDYEQLLLTYGTDYKEVRHERTTAIIHDFFAPCAVAKSASSTCASSLTTKVLPGGCCLLPTRRWKAIPTTSP